MGNLPINFYGTVFEVCFLLVFLLQKTDMYKIYIQISNCFILIQTIGPSNAIYSNWPTCLG